MNDPDPTVRLARPGHAVPAAPARAAPPAPAPASRPAGGRTAILAAMGGALVAAGAGAWIWFGRDAGPPEPPPKPDSATESAPPASVPAASQPTAPLPALLRIPLVSEEAIASHRAAEPTLFRLADNPRVFVADFPGLEVQAAALNRIAALVEKVGAPRDRVLDDAALAEAIARSGETPATYYYGHNYRGRDLERFFALAARDGIALTAEEVWLRDQVATIRRLLPPGEDFALISVPGVGQRVDGTMRAAILHHEIGHGHFFTNPAFAAHVARVWQDVFTEAERARFRAFLQREGYDPALEEVMMNEAMAYLIFTPDARFFTPAHAGLDEQRAETLRAAFREHAPR